LYAISKADKGIPIQPSVLCAYVKGQDLEWEKQYFLSPKSQENIVSTILEFVV
jgi:hypothetical protein